jgi:hypothetical protein
MDGLGVLRRAGVGRRSALLGTGERGTKAALAATARLSFLLF